MNKKLWIWTIIVISLVFFCIIAPLLAPHDPNATNALLMRAAPNSEYPWGNDTLGRCVLSRVLNGASVSVLTAVGLVLLTGLAGSVLGVMCGLVEGLFDTVLMRLADFLLSIPQMVLAIAVAGILDSGLSGACIAISITAWISYARLARAQVIRLKQEPFIRAAKMSGCPRAQMVLFHILPHCLGPLAIQAALQLGQTMTALAGLSFLGLGIPAPQAEWGSMIREGIAYFQVAPWIVLAPAISMIIVVLAFNEWGEALQKNFSLYGNR